MLAGVQALGPPAGSDEVTTLPPPRSTATHSDVEAHETLYRYGKELVLSTKEVVQACALATDRRENESTQSNASTGARLNLRVCFRCRKMDSPKSIATSDGCRAWHGRSSRATRVMKSAVGNSDFITVAATPSTYRH